MEDDESFRLECLKEAVTVMTKRDGHVEVRIIVDAAREFYEFVRPPAKSRD